MVKENIKICFFPGRESSYVRNRVLLKGMKEAGLTVYDCSYPKRNFIRYLVGFVKFLHHKKKCDLIFIGFFGQLLVPLIKPFTKKKIIFDAFLSAYQTLAFDRSSITSDSLTAKIVRHIERKSCLLADTVLLDTQQHINYFEKEYRIDKNKFVRSFLGSDDFFLPQQDNRPYEDFIVHFHGEFQSLHGIKYILQAAQLLPHVKFRMVGGGRDLTESVELAKQLNLTNVTFIPPVAYNEIPRYISEASICLGIFGETQKTQLVIPLKIYESLALGKPIITADTPAVRELLTHKRDVYLCKTADPKALAEAIEILKLNEPLRTEIARNGYETYQNRCSPLIIGREIRELVNQLCG